MSLVYDLIAYVLLVIAALVPVTNPFSNAPLFISMTASLNQWERHRTETLACADMRFRMLFPAVQSPHHRDHQCRERSAG